MKVDNLLGPYLYQYKKLSLPGIGLFTLDDKAVLPDETAKVKMAIEGITFNPKTGAQLDDSLILYIKDQTGKMKALAEADLYSYIATAFQYLNIGKPFYFEGIGTLQKNKDNAYTFTAGTMIQQKTDEIPHKHVESKRKPAHGNEDAVGGGSSFNGGKLVVLLGVLATLGLIGWGGYYLYNKNTGDAEPVVQQESKPAAAVDTTAATDTTATTPDSLAVSKKPDSNLATAAVTAPNTTGYKFILETTEKKARAAKRYEQLKGVSMLPAYGNKIAVETKDSLSFKIYTIVPCTAADTAKVKESLNAWYYGAATMKVKIEQ